MSRVYLTFLTVMMSFACLCFSSDIKENDKNMTQHEDATSKQNPIVLIQTTMGDIKIELFPEKAPITVKNFLKYVNEGFYNQTIFHRVIDGFMIQGGGLTANFDEKKGDAPIQNEANNGLSNKIGSIAMARTSNPHSASSQFFINVADNQFLNFKSERPSEFGYAVFGQVVEGMDVVNQIKKVKTTTKRPFENVPEKTIEIISAKQIQ